ncbi:MAG TPA: hypothetical protein VEH53_05465 [archaeon]|nr:hypothetical protein [archaeon]
MAVGQAPALRVEQLERLALSAGWGPTRWTVGQPALRWGAWLGVLQGVSQAVAPPEAGRLESARRGLAPPGAGH